MAKFFSIPFAEDGDRAPIPNNLQGDGSVSYQQGYGFDYERPPEDDDRKLIERPEANQLYHDITAAIGEIQRYGAALWQAAAAPYPLGAQVYHTDGLWASVAAGNSQEPGTGSQWVRTMGVQDRTPIGVAMPYFGELSAIPPNYAICNGQNGTPDLTNRMLVGSGGDFSRGETGGSTQTQAAGQHNHAITVAPHALTPPQIPAHTHDVTGRGNNSPGGVSYTFWSGDTTVGERTIRSSSTGGGQAHSHGASSAAAGQHQHSFMPRYLAAVWIMRMY